MTNNLVLKVRSLDFNDSNAKEYVINESMRIFKSQSTELSSQGANEWVDLIVEIASIASKLGCGYDIVSEGWKCYVKLLKTNSRSLSRETCNKVADALCKAISDGIHGLLQGQASENRLSLLHFYHQRVSATLAYCVHLLDDSKIIDLHFQMAAARGVLHLQGGLSSRLNIKEKMDGNFLKSMIHPDTNESSQHCSCFLGSTIRQSSSIWSFRPQLEACRYLGVYTFQLLCMRQLNIYPDESLNDLFQSLCVLLEHLLVADLMNMKDVTVVELVHDLATTFAGRLNSQTLANATRNKFMVEQTNNISF